MPKVKMTKTDRGCPDGITLTEYEAGQTYELNDSLAKAFVVDLCSAVYVDGTEDSSPAQDAPPADEAKAEDPVDENKDLGAAPENKSGRGVKKNRKGE